MCGEANETARHIFDKCESITLKTERLAIRRQMPRPDLTNYLKLSDLLLSDHATERLLELAGKEYAKIDRVRKMGVRNFMRHFPEP